MNPTPTDPREEKPASKTPRIDAAWAKEADDELWREGAERVVEEARKIELELNQLKEIKRPFSDKLADEVIQGQVRRIIELESTNSNLAAEIAELKSTVQQCCESINHHIELEATLRAELEAVNTRYSELAAKRAKTDQLYQLALNNQEDLGKRLEAARKERDERKADLKMFMEMHDTALAAKDAAEKMLREINFAIAGLFWTSDDGFHMRDSDPDESGAPRWFIEKWKALRAALTPAPTQEPPAGGVTISNDSSRVEGHAEAEGRPGYMGNAQPSEYQASPAVTSSTSPADVQPEGRGEWMPFDLDAALGGAEMITRDGTPAKDFRRIEGKAPFPKYPYEATVNDTVYSYTGKGKFFDPYEEALDLFMLPTEGSGA